MDLGSRLDLLESQLGDIRDSHPVADLGVLREQYHADPLGFIRNVLHGEPWEERQGEIARGIVTDPQVVVQSCNGAGKDWLAARLAVWAATMGWYVIITGPTERQVKSVLMDDAYGAWSRATPRLPGEFFELGWRITRKEKSGILAFTATDASRITGLHAPKLFAIVTEAQGVKDLVYEGIRACLTGGTSRFLALGNPVAPEGEFYRICRSAGWKRVHIAAADCPNVRQDAEVVPGGISRRFVADIEADYGKDSPQYQTRVLGLFPETSSEAQLYSPSALETAYVRHATRAPEVDAAVTLGVDPARGVDETTICVKRGSRIEGLYAKRTPDLMAAVGWIREIAKQYHVKPKDDEGPAAGLITVDAIGLGGGVADRLKEERFRVVAFQGSRAPEGKSKSAVECGNLRASAYWRLRKLLDDGTLALPRDAKLHEELLATRYLSSSSGKLFIEPKEQLKQRIHRSPDRADAVVLACWESPRISGLAAVGQW